MHGTYSQFALQEPYTVQQLLQRRHCSAADTYSEEVMSTFTVEKVTPVYALCLLPRRVLG